tara:strand:- start:892 stop:1329 length:438 start_codon:yes stop_codon:yes gene_type:complete
VQHIDKQNLIENYGMKKNIILILLVIGINFVASAQEVTLTKSEIEKVLCKQWGIEYAMMNGMEIRQMPGATDFDFIFTSDGSYDLIREDGDNESGTWVYNVANKNIELSIEENMTSRIKSIDENKMIVTLVSERLPGVEIHFKPI